MSLFIYEQSLYRADTHLYFSKTKGEVEITTMEPHHLRNALRRIEQDCLAMRDRYQQSNPDAYAKIQNLTIPELCSVFVPQYSRLANQDVQNRLAAEADEAARLATTGQLQVLPVVNPTNAEIHAALNPLTPEWNSETGQVDMKPSENTPAAVVTIQEVRQFTRPTREFTLNLAETLIQALNDGPDGMSEADYAALKANLSLASKLIPKPASGSAKTGKTGVLSAELDTLLSKLDLTGRRHDTTVLRKLYELTGASIVKDLAQVSEADLWLVGAEPDQVEAIRSLLSRFDLDLNTIHALVYQAVQIPHRQTTQHKVAGNTRWLGEFNASYDEYLAGNYRLKEFNSAKRKTTTRQAVAWALRERLHERLRLKGKLASGARSNPVSVKSGVRRVNAETVTNVRSTQSVEA